MLQDLTIVWDNIAGWCLNVQPLLTSVLDNIASWWSLNVQGTMTIAAVVQMVAAVIGFLVLIYQVLKLRNNLEGATQDRLYAHYTEICKLFMQNPELQPYFYGRSEDAGKTVTRERAQECNDNLPPKVAFMCEAILGLVEHAVLQKKNLPGDAWKNCWRPYAMERLERSEALENFFDPNAHWYSRRMRRAMNSMNRALKRKKKRAARKAARAAWKSVRAFWKAARAARMKQQHSEVEAHTACELLRAKIGNSQIADNVSASPSKAEVA
jgi:hypothetical protein